MSSQALVRRRKRKVKRREPTDKELDRRRASTAYFKLGTLLHDLNDWGSDIARYKKKGITLVGEKLLLESMLECAVALKKSIGVLRNEKSQITFH